MEPDTQRMIDLLKICFKILGVSNRELARKLDMSPSYVSKLLSGTSPLRLDHVVRICYAVEMEPYEFFKLAYPYLPAKPSAAMEKLRRLLGGFRPPPPPEPEEPPSQDGEDNQKDSEE